MPFPRAWFVPRGQLRRESVSGGALRRCEDDARVSQGLFFGAQDMGVATALRLISPWRAAVG